MVNQHDPEQSAVLLQRRGEAGKLLFAKFAGRHERSGRQRRRERDQCDGATAAYERKRAACRTIIATHVVAPIPGRPTARLRYIGVMIAGDYGDVRRRPDVVEPRARPRVFDRQRQIDEVAGHSDVVGRDRFQVARNRIEHLGAVDIFASTVPIDETEPALARKLGKLRP